MLVTHVTIIMDTGKELEFDLSKWNKVETNGSVTFTHVDGKREWAFAFDHISAVFRKGKEDE